MSMNVTKYETREEWMLGRRGKITGSRLKDIVIKRGTGKKIGFYELIAERIGIEGEAERPMDRGTRLEEEALERFQEETGIKLDTSLVIWQRDDAPDIAISPDGFKGLTIGAEAKCLSAARHIEAWLTQTIPSEYEYQKLQYFIVNDKLKKLYFIFYDPRVLLKDFFYIEVNREDVQEEVDELLDYERKQLAEVDEIVAKLIKESTMDSG